MDKQHHYEDDIIRPLGVHLPEDDVQLLTEIQHTTEQYEVRSKKELLSQKRLTLSQVHSILDEVNEVRKQRKDRVLEDDDIRDLFCLKRFYPALSFKEVLSFMDELKEQGQYEVWVGFLREEQERLRNEERTI